MAPKLLQPFGNVNLLNLCVVPAQPPVELSQLTVSGPLELGQIIVGEMAGTKLVSMELSLTK